MKGHSFSTTPKSLARSAGSARAQSDKTILGLLFIFRLAVARVVVGLFCKAYGTPSAIAAAAVNTAAYPFYELRNQPPRGPRLVSAFDLLCGGGGVSLP